MFIVYHILIGGESKIYIFWEAHRKKECMNAILVEVGNPR